jgi:hypothetical protein
LAGGVRWNLKNLIGFRVDDPRYKVENAGQKVRKQTLDWLHEEDLIFGSVEVADHSASME